MTASNNAIVCSAAETALAPGALRTSTPARVAAFKSILSTPTPARATTRKFRPAVEDLLGDLRLTADDEGVGFANGVEQCRDVHAVDIDDPRRGGESIARGWVNGVADDNQRTGFHPVGLGFTAVRCDGVVHGILPSAGDMGGDDIEEGIEIVGGRDHRIVELVAGLPRLDQKASHARGGIVTGMT